jgi:hypothetical protein
MRTSDRVTIAATKQDSADDLDSLSRSTATKTIQPPASMIRVASTLIDDACIPVRNLERARLNMIELDHRAAFLLLHVDGVSSFRDIIESSSIDAVEAKAMFADLVDRDVLSILDTRAAPLRSTCRAILPPPPQDGIDDTEVESLARVDQTWWKKQR